MPKMPKDPKDLNGASIAGSEKEVSRLKWFSHFHLWDFITATSTRGKPDWFTAKIIHPLQTVQLYNRWSNPAELIGVRFRNGKEGTTVYAVIDIDVGSAYHPKNDLESFLRISEALEDIGLCRSILISSSYSNGLHIYFPFEEAFNCYRVAAAFQICLEQAGFEIKNGQLEIFPNLKQPRSLYKAHRLPLQVGSFVLDHAFNPVHNSIDRFIDSWKIAAQSQDLETFATAIAQAKISRGYPKGDPAEWKERLAKTIEDGWTAKGQTNQILKEACIYARVFEGLEWSEVEGWVLQTISAMKGYDAFCQHKKDINRRVRDWVNANRKSGRYYPYGKNLKKKEPKGPNNEDRESAALERIEKAIAQLKTSPENWPKTVRDRLKLISDEAHCSATTLYKYPKLWHPRFEIQSCVTDCSERALGDSEGDRGHQRQESFEIQSRVTPCPEGDTEILEVEKIDQDNARADEEQNQSLVTVEPVRVRAISQLCLELTLVPEMPIPASVTDPSLLSVISDEGLAPHHLFSSDDGNQTLDQVLSTKAKLKSSRSIQKPRSQFSQRNKYKQATFNFESHNQLKQTPQIQPNQIVRRKADGIEGPRFKVKQIQSNGRVWLQWLDEKVPLVDVCSSINDLELIA